jgi:uncharacterized membrane protein YgcG
LEALLPNEQVGRIGSKMLPDLQHGDHSKAVLRAARELATIIAANRKVTLKTADQGLAP